MGRGVFSNYDHESNWIRHWSDDGLDSTGPTITQRLLAGAVNRAIVVEGYLISHVGTRGAQHYVLLATDQNTSGAVDTANAVALTPAKHMPNTGVGLYMNDDAELRIAPGQSLSFINFNVSGAVEHISVTVWGRFEDIQIQGFLSTGVSALGYNP